MRVSEYDFICLFEEVESLVAGFWETQFPGETVTWSPATDVFVAGAEVFVIVELPGVARENLKVAVSPVLVDVTGTRSTPDFFARGTSFYELEIPRGAFRKRITLPCRIDPRRLRAELKDGLLTIRMQKAGDAGSARTRRK